MENGSFLVTVNTFSEAAAFITNTRVLKIFETKKQINTHSEFRRKLALPFRYEVVFKNYKNFDCNCSSTRCFNKPVDLKSIFESPRRNFIGLLVKVQLNELFMFSCSDLFSLCKDSVKYFTNLCRQSTGANYTDKLVTGHLQLGLHS